MDDAPLKLAEPLEAFVEDQVRSGAYPDRGSLMADAVRRLKADFEDDDAKMERLQRTLREAKARLDRGEGILVTDIDAYTEDIWREATNG